MDLYYHSLIRLNGVVLSEAQGLSLLLPLSHLSFSEHFLLVSYCDFNVITYCAHLHSFLQVWRLSRR
jgi:hypothetical protein